jgi:hypothetical protein
MLEHADRVCFKLMGSGCGGIDVCICGRVDERGGMEG